MLYRLRRTTAALCLIVLVACTVTPSSASARRSSILNNSDSEANNETSPVMVDLILLRPLGLMTFVLSTALFVVPVLPITLVTRPTEIGKPMRLMLVVPFRYVWVDPLGSH